MKLIIFIFLALQLVTPLTKAQSGLNVSRLNESQIKVLIEPMKTVGGALQLIRMTSPTEDYIAIRDLILSEGFKESDRLPTFFYNKGWVTTSKGKRGYDFSGLINGQFDNGKQSWRSDPAKTKFQNYKDLKNFIAPSSKTSLFEIVTPRANAEGSDSIMNTGKSLALLALAAHSTYSAISFVSAAVAGGVTAGSALLVGGAAVLALTAESLAKSGVRYLKGSSIYCSNGRLFISDPTGMTDENKEIKWSAINEVGVAELKFREYICSHPDALDNFKKAVVETVSSAKTNSNKTSN